LKHYQGSKRDKKAKKIPLNRREENLNVNIFMIRGERQTEAALQDLAGFFFVFYESRGLILVRKIQIMKKNSQ
jgi:hypothetical protein